MLLRRIVAGIDFYRIRFYVLIRLLALLPFESSILFSNLVQDAFFVLGLVISNLLGFFRVFNESSWSSRCVDVWTLTPEVRISTEARLGRLSISP